MKSSKINNRFLESEKWIQSYEREFKNTMVLDAGAGEQRLKKFFNNNRYISQDFGEYRGGRPP